MDALCVRQLHAARRTEAIQDDLEETGPAARRRTDLGLVTLPRPQAIIGTSCQVTSLRRSPERCALFTSWSESLSSPTALAEASITSGLEPITSQSPRSSA